MSLSLIIAIIVIIINSKNLFLKKRQSDTIDYDIIDEKKDTKTNKVSSFLDTVEALMKEYTEDKDEILVQNNKKESENHQRIRDEYQERYSNSYRQHHRPDRLKGDKKILKNNSITKNAISDDNSSIFTNEDLLAQQLVKNIIFSEILSPPKSKR